MILKKINIEKQNSMFIININIFLHKCNLIMICFYLF